MSAKLIKAVRRISETLTSKGVHPLSPYWLAEITRFYRHPTARMLVENVGRGGDKSRSSVVMSIAEVLDGDFRIAPGERHYFTHVSENKEEAAKTAGVLKQYLKILAVPFRSKGDTIELKDAPRGWKVLAARTGAVSGWRCIGWTADEAAKWNSEGADPSSEVIASIRAMTVTHPTARGRMISSPLGSSGYFFDRWSKGDTRSQIAGHAATWEANPSVSEEYTHTLEDDPRVWAREYAALAQSGISAAFEQEDVLAAFAPQSIDMSATPGRWVIIIDASSGGKDLFTWCAARHVKFAGGRRGVQLRGIDSVKWTKATTTESIVARIALFAKEIGAREAFGDQRDARALESLFQRHKLSFTEQTWSAPNKPEAVEGARKWFREGCISLPPHERLKSELLNFEEIVLPSGQFSFRARASGHDDHVSLILTLALAVEAGRVPTASGSGSGGSYAHLLRSNRPPANRDAEPIGEPSGTFGGGNPNSNAHVYVAPPPTAAQLSAELVTQGHQDSRVGLHNAQARASVAQVIATTIGQPGAPTGVPAFNGPTITPGNFSGSSIIPGGKK